jgi:hypothetical protein
MIRTGRRGVASSSSRSRYYWATTFAIFEPLPPVPASTRRPEFLAPGPFLFTIGNCLPHKNFHFLFELAERLPGRRVVIAGRNDTPYGGFLARELTRRR